MKKQGIKKIASPVKKDCTAARFLRMMKSFQSDNEREKLLRYFKSEDEPRGAQDQFMGIRMGQLFEIAKAFVAMDPKEIEKLMESRLHEVRAGAMSIMNYQARDKKTPDTRRKELFDLYLKRHDRINNWDLVDVSAVYVIGRYLTDKPRKILYKLALSKNKWERRTAIVSTAYFLRTGETEDTFTIAELLVDDKEDLIHKAVGGWIRQAGKSNKDELLRFLDKHASKMPRTMLRYAIEHLNKKQKEYYLTC